jgi:hypothetical protein
MTLSNSSDAFRNRRKTPKNSFNKETTAKNWSGTVQERNHLIGR